MERFFRRLMELRPVDASYYGLHEFDGRLPEGGLSAAREELALVGVLERELAHEGDGLDAELGRYYAGLARFQAEELRLWARMPDAPDVIGSGIFLLVARDFAPLGERLESITGRRRSTRVTSAKATRKVTDPQLLERRRQALAKAREVRAAKRASRHQ
jgi:hypothetical protein